MNSLLAERETRNLLAAALADGEWTTAGIAKRMSLACGRRLSFLRTFAGRLTTSFPESPSFDVVMRFAEGDGAFLRGVERNSIEVRKLFWVRPRMTPAGPARAWAVPTFTTTAALAEWLGLDESQLDWFADVAGRNGKDSSPRLRHYTVRWLSKGSRKHRLLESPKKRLKAIQRRIMHDILDRIPPHPAAHAFRPGRSVVSYAEPHVGQAVVLRFDLVDFFLSISRARVEAVFHTAGYPEAVARKLAGLCTSRLPRNLWDARPRPAADGSDHAAWQRLNQPHLPQGAPTSPALANLAAYRLDCRLAALAAAAGATYTRYADDLAFSGGNDLARGWRRFQTAVAVIASEEGFSLAFRKTRVMRPGQRQQLAGVVVNVRPNVSRADHDRLKAVLTNCARSDPESQNRERRPDFRAYLLGKVAHAAMVNPARGARLRALFDRIRWPDPPTGSTMTECPQPPAT